MASKLSLNTAAHAEFMLIASHQKSQIQDNQQMDIQIERKIID